MGLSVNFNTSRGQIYTRNFLPGEGISIFGKATTLNGLINPGTQVRMNIETNFGNSLFSDDSFTDLFGDYDFYFRAPENNTQLNVIVQAVYPLSGTDKVVIPISIGNVQPKPLPELQGEKSIFDYLGYLLIVGVGYGIYKVLEK